MDGTWPLAEKVYLCFTATPTGYSSTDHRTSQDMDAGTHGITVLEYTIEQDPCTALSATGKQDITEQNIRAKQF